MLTDPGHQRQQRISGLTEGFRREHARVCVITGQEHSSTVMNSLNRPSPEFKLT